MTEEYKHLKKALLELDEVRDEIIKIDADTYLTEDEKYAKMAEIALIEYIKRHRS